MKLYPKSLSLKSNQNNFRLLFAFLYLCLSFNLQSQNFDCSTAIKIEGQSTITGNIKTVPITEFPDLQGNYFRSHWYEIEGDDVFIDFSVSGDPNISVTLLEGNCSSYKNLGDVHNYVLRSGVKYFIVVSKPSYVVQDINYELIIARQNAVSYDFCETPILVEYGKAFEVDFDLLTTSVNEPNGSKFGWFKIIGNGKINTVEFINAAPIYVLNVFPTKNSCTDIEYLDMVNITNTTNEYFSFVAQEGREYIFAIASQFIEGNGSKIVKLIINEQNINTSGLNCENAINIACEEETQMNFLDNIPINDIQLSCEENFSKGNALWYKIEKGNDVKEFTFDSNNDFYGKAVLVEDLSINGDCKNLSCLGSYDIGFYSNKVTIFASPVRDKYLKIIKSSGDLNSVKVKCVISVPTNTCLKNAKTILCGDTLRSGNLAPIANNECSTFSNSRWYKLEGKNVLHNFLTKEENYEILINIYQEVEGSEPILITYLENFALNFSILTNDLPLYLEIKPSYKPIEVVYSCEKIEDNICSLTKEIFCGDKIELYKLPIIARDIIPDGGLIPFSYYFSYKALDKSMNIRFENMLGNVNVFSKNCETIVPLASFDNSVQDGRFWGNFKLNEGEEYYIQLELYSSGSLNSIFFIDCENLIDENYYSKCPTIDCSKDIINFPVSKGLIDLTYNNNSGESIIYKLEVNGNLIDIVSINNFHISFVLFEDENGKPGKEVDRFTSKMRFQTMAGKTYFLTVSRHPWDFIPSIECTISCVDTTVNSSCENAIEIECGDKVFANEKYPTEYSWYKIVGDDKFYEFSSLRGEMFLAFYKNNCNSGFSNFETSFSIGKDNKSKKVFLRKGISYFIKMDNNDNKGIFKVKCIEQLPDTPIENAQILNCGDKIKFKPSQAKPNVVFINGKLGFIEDNSKWVVLAGDGSVVKLNYHPSHYLATHYYKSVNNELLPMTDFPEEFVNGVLKTIPNEKYYILIAGTSNDIETIDIEVSCTLILNDGCQNAKTISCGEEFQFDNTFAENSSFGNYTIPEKANWFKIKGDGQSKVLSLKNDFESNNFFTVYVAKANCNNIENVKAFTIFRNDLYEPLDLEIDTMYYLFISSFSTAIADFEVTCVSNQINTTCNQASLLNCGDEVHDNSYFSSMEASDPCQALSAGLYYKVVGNGEVYEIKSLLNTELYYDVSVREGSCNGPCVFNASINRMYNNSAFFETQTGKEYFIKISSNETKSIDFIINCKPNFSFLCEDAVMIKCDTTITAELIPFNNPPFQSCGFNYSPLWIKLAAISHSYRIKIKSTNQKEGIRATQMITSKGLCNSDCAYRKIIDPEDLNKEYAFPAFPDLDNYLFFTSSTQGTYEKFDAEITCFVADENDECFNAKEISCNSKIKGSLRNVTQSTNDGRCVKEKHGYDAWYKFIGNGDNITISTSLNNELDGYVSVHENLGECYKDITCLGFFRTRDLNNKISFKTTLGQEYYILVGGSNFENDYEFDFKCGGVKPYDFCLDAYDLNNSSSELDLDLDSLTADILPCNVQHENPGLWLKKEGNDSTLVLEVLNNKKIHVSILEGDCSEMTCLINNLSFNTNKFNYFLEKDKTYFIYISSEEKSARIRVQDIEGRTNNTCLGAKKVSCNDFITFNTNDYMIDYSSPFCNAGIQSVAWFEYVGDGNLMIIDKVDGSKSPQFSIYEECDQPCIYAPYSFDILNYPEFAYLTEIGKKYLIKVIIPYPFFEVSLQVRCSEPYENIKKENAELIKCQNYKIDETKIGDDFKHNNLFNSLWYTFVGNAGVMKISNLSINHGINVYFGNNIVHTFSGPTPQGFTTTFGVPYLLQVPKYHKPFEFDVNYKCIDAIDELSSKKNGLHISPNPFNDRVKISLKLENSSNSTLRIIDALGKEVYTKENILYEGENTIELQVSDIGVPGIYTCIVEVKGGRFVGKICLME